MIADRTAQQDAVARPNRPWIQRQPAVDLAHTERGDVHAVARPVLDDLGVAADDRNAGAARSLGHGFDFGPQCGRRKAGFEDKGRHQRFGTGAGDRQVVDRAVHGELANRTAGKTQRLDDEAIGRGGIGRAAKRKRGSIRELSEDGVRKQRRDEPFDQPSRGFPARTVRHLDLCVVEANARRRSLDRGHLKR
jgi:hypothetical protein